MNKRQLSKLKQYIKEDRPQRLKSYVRKHQLDLSTVELKHNRTLLHYCCQHGSGSVLRYLLREGVDGLHVDEALESLLHVALDRALRYEDLGKHQQSAQCYTDLVLPVLEKFPQLLDGSNTRGVTCRQLLTRLVKMREISHEKENGSDSDSEGAGQRGAEAVREKLWRDKIADEYQFEYDTTWGQYEQDFGDYEDTRETYDDWTERIRQQYHAKKHAQREAEYAASDRKRRKTDDQYKAADSEAGKLEEERRKMREKYERNQKKDRELKYLKKKMKYEKDYKSLFERKDKTNLGYSDIPWPGGDKSDDDIVILMQGLEKGSGDYKKYLREQQIRWHPDKFLQRFGSHIITSEKDRIMKRVTDLSQKLNKLSE